MNTQEKVNKLFRELHALEASAKTRGDALIENGREVPETLSIKLTGGRGIVLKELEYNKEYGGWPVVIRTDGSNQLIEWQTMEYELEKGWPKEK